MDDPSAFQHPEWRLLASKKRPVAVYDTTIGPLLTTTWDQLPYYNNLCPNGPNGQAVTGCVATAMGQVMKYWNWPDTGAGSYSYINKIYGPQSADFVATSYDWEHMPDYFNATSSSIEVNAVATLLYHCGVTVNIQYGNASQGIGVPHEAAESSPFLVQKMLCATSLNTVLRNMVRIDFTDDEWTAQLKTKLTI